MAKPDGVNFLYHYYERSIGPFKNLSDLPPKDAQILLDGIKAKGEVFAAQRSGEYLSRRRELEMIAREIFISKGGKPVRRVPHYMVVEECIWLESWYKEGCFVKIPIAGFDPETISFSYGDLFPTFSDKITDNKEYRQNVYTLNEILELISKYGLPQYWNPDGKLGPERYIEVQVWSDDPVIQYY